MNDYAFMKSKFSIENILVRVKVREVVVGRSEWMVGEYIFRLAWKGDRIR